MSERTKEAVQAVLDAKRREQELSWSDVMWAWIKRGYPREEAAHQADEFMRRRYRERVRELQQFARSIKK
jgi:hypothetical protein